jgi:hypothetical protein
MDRYIDTALHILTLGTVGGIIGLGQLLLGKDVLTLRLVLGRAISSGGLATAAAVALQFYPGMSNAMEIGLAAALASLGTSGLEALVQHFFGVGSREPRED